MSIIEVEAPAVYARAIATNSVATKSINSKPIAFEGGRPLIGLVLGSGAARGFAHIGVIHALSAAGIKPEPPTLTSR